MSGSTRPDNEPETAEPRSNTRIQRCNPIIRFGHIFFSLVLTLFGIGLLLGALTMRMELHFYLPFLNYYLGTPILVLIAGCVVLIGIGSLGFLSSAAFIYNGIVTFGVFVFGLLMFKLTLGILVLATLSSAEQSIEKALESAIDNYTYDAASIIYVQTNLYCCGAQDYTDWYTTLGYIPGSCCDSDTACEPADVIDNNAIGCYEALVTLMDQYIRIYLLILGVLIAMEIGAISVTVMLVRNVKQRQKIISSYEENRRAEIQEPEVPKVTKNPMAVRNNLLQGNQSTNKVSPFPKRKTSETTVRLPERRLASFNYPINSNRVVPSAPPMPSIGQKYPRVF